MFSLFELVWKRIRLFFTDDEVFYIGGADVLPPPLEREQENRCLIALSGLHGDSEPMTREDARKQLIEHNLRLVVYLARKFENTGICVEDLISIGTIGLIKGINTFNPEKKIKLATYASRCIENEILMYLRRNNKVKLEVSIDEPLNVDWDGNELLLSDILGTDEDIIYRDMENEAEIMLLRTAVNTLTPRGKRNYLSALWNRKKRRQGNDPERSGRPAWNFAILYFETGEKNYGAAEKINSK